MDTKVLQTLQFTEVIHALLACAQTDLGQQHVRTLVPDCVACVHWMQQTAEAVQLAQRQGLPSFEGIADVLPAVHHATIEGTLSANALWTILQTLTTAQRIRTHVRSHVDSVPSLFLAQQLEKMDDFPALIGTLHACIDEQGEIKDTASEALQKCRRLIRTCEQRIRQQLEAMLRQTTIRTMLQETLITVRNERFVFPVKAEYRASFPGIIHDQSSSGATVFIEPQTIVQENNQLKLYRLEEQKEMERILFHCSQAVKAEATQLHQHATVLGELDFWCAKARYAQTIHATRPQWDEHGKIDFRQARHPLLDPARLVPLDLMLTAEDTTLLITGPNTGGKTVTLKTVGLLHLMAMAGLYIPVAEGSVCSRFENIFVDIGDEQSISQNLSTFSGHMRNIVDMVRQLTPTSLVLLDEVGAGTDPTEGAALATAILSHMQTIGCKLLATTHFSELKAYAYHRPHTQNAAMEFDVNTLQPTYRLRLGLPGRSHALTIAQRLGLPSALLAQAQQYLSEDDKRIERMIAFIEEQRQAIVQERAEATAQRQQYERLHQQSEMQRQKDEAARETLWKKAQQQARQYVHEAKHEAQAIVAALREQAKAQQATLKEHELRQKVRALDSIAVPTRAQPTPARSATTPPLKKGDEVTVSSLQLKGFILDIQGQEATVQVGLMKTKVHLDDVHLSSPTTGAKKSPSYASSKKRPSDMTIPVRVSLDVRGKQAEEAITDVDRWLDEAVMNQLQTGTVIHGKGTGVLRQRLHDFLRHHPHVQSFRLGAYGEGDMGVSIITFK